MISFEDSRKLARAFVSKENEETKGFWARIEQPENFNELALTDWFAQSENCYAFSYTSKKFIETQDLRHALVGQGPLIIDRRSKKVIPTGSAFSIDIYLENYEKHGDPHKKTGTTVRILKELRDKQRVYAIKSVRNWTQLGLKDSKEGIEAVIEGSFIDVQAKSSEAAEKLFDELTAFGYEAKRM